MKKPDDAAWMDFSSAISHAAATAQVNFDAGGTAGTVEALMAVVRMLEATDAESKTWLPFLRLAMALSDLKAGSRVHPILEPARKPESGGKPIGNHEQVHRGAIAALLELAIERKEFASVEQAARWTARHADLNPASKIKPWQQVMKWREAVRVTRDDDNQARNTYDAFLKTLRALPQVHRDDLARKIVEVAQEFKHQIASVPLR
jgi:hypothetical protein